MSSKKPCILIADDNVDLGKILSDRLAYQGYETIVATDGQEALTLAAVHPLALALVDVWMPGPSGMQLVTQLKELQPNLEVIIITAYGSIEDAAEAVRQGAFHYLTKPFKVKLLQATVEEALAARRARARIQVGEWTVDLLEERVSSIGSPVTLTSLEERLLICLARWRGQVVGYGELWRKGWGYDSRPDRVLIQRSISRLREKLGKEWIVTIRGRGYCLR
jgi:DNA-binding response OmpR family regulator